MFKAVFILDCDECGRSLTTASVCSTPYLEHWEFDVGVLMLDAERDGWGFMRHYGICPECIREDEKMVDYLQEPEDYN